MEGLRDYWIFRLGVNLLGYASVGIPIFALIYLVKHRGLLDRLASDSSVAKFIRKLVNGEDVGTLIDGEGKGGGGSRSWSDNESFLRRAASLSFCFVGLQAAFLTWGVLQERIMTIPYGQNGDLSVAGEKFTNSQFLVFMNRVSAFVVAGIIVAVK